MKHVSRILLTVIALILVVSMVTSCGIVNIIANYIVSGMTQSGAVDFDSLEYTRPDFNEIIKAFDDFLIDIKAGKSVLALQIALSNAYLLFNDAQTQYAIAQIDYYNNVNNETAKSETEYCAEEFAKVQVKLVEVYAAIVEYGHSNALLTGWTQQDFDNLEIQKTLYDDEYIELQAKITKLQNDYMELQSSVTVAYNGENYTVDEVVEFYENEQISYTVYRQLITKYYENLATEATPLYLELVSYNNRIAEKAGFDSYQEYAYRFDYYRDYTPADAEKVYNYVKNTVSALHHNISYAIDPEIISTIYSKPHLISDYNSTFSNYFSSISSEMKEAYHFMQRYNLSSIGNTSGMQQAGFTTFLPSYEMPYIYLYTLGTIDDISSFVHEFGHFYAFYRNTFESDNIIDVSEIHSQTNELLFLPYYDLTEEELKHYTLSKLSDMYQTIIEGCIMDEFQKEIHQNITQYTTVDDVNAAFKQIADEYGYDEFYPGLPYEALWAAISHNFVAPFYYISYTVSALTAIEIYSISLNDRDQAIEIYLDIVDETGYRTYLEKLEDNGLHSPFERDIYTVLINLTDSLIQNVSKTSAELTLPKPYHFLGLAA